MTARTPTTGMPHARAKMGYLAAALPIVFQQKDSTWWFLKPKGMGLDFLLIELKRIVILDLLL